MQQNESMDPHRRERMRRRGEVGPQEMLHQARYQDPMILAPPQEMSDVQKFLLRQHPLDYLAPNFELKTVVKERGQHEGLDAQEICSRQSLMALHRRSGFIRDPASQSQDWRDDPRTIDDQVRVIDEYPITAGEYFARPLSCQYDRVAAESALIQSNLGFLYHADMDFDDFVDEEPQRFPAANAVPPVFNYNNPIDRVEVRNASANQRVWMAFDQDATVGNNLEFIVEAGETRSFDVRSYRYISLVRNATVVDAVRLTVYSFKDSHNLLNSWQRITNKVTGGMPPN